MNTHLKVIIPSYNSVKWLKKTLHSVAIQTYQNCQVCVIDDASTQAGQKELIEWYCEKYNWQAIYRTENQGALSNIVEGIKLLGPADEDAILLLDGDDWIFNKHVFEKVAKEYASPSTFLTYGQFITYPRWQVGFCKPISPELYISQNFKKDPFIFSHLRTFRFKIWKAIDEKDFLDAAGNYYRTAWDLAIMYPLLEMTGGQGCKFIEQILYVYNMDNPLNDCNAHKQLQSQTALQIINKAPYQQTFYSSYVPHRSEGKIKNRWIAIYKKLITPVADWLVIKKLLKKCKCPYIS